MGLDQYARWTASSDVNADDAYDNGDEFKYWRKCSHIQNWFQKIYAEKTGDTDAMNFNCVKVEIDFELLNRFITDVKTNQMQCVDGFFFGGSYDTNHPDIVEEDLRFACDCMFHLLMGRKVYYTSWW